MAARRREDVLARIFLSVVGCLAAFGVCGIMAFNFVGCAANGTENRIGDWRELVDEPGGGIFVPDEAVAVKAESHQNMVSYGGLVVFKFRPRKRPKNGCARLPIEPPACRRGK